MLVTNCAKRILRPLRVGPLEIHVCNVWCPDFFGKLPRGSKGVTALWPRGVLNEILKNHVFDQFQTRLRGGKTGIEGSLLSSGDDTKRTDCQCAVS